MSSGVAEVEDFLLPDRSEVLDRGVSFPPPGLDSSGVSPVLYAHLAPAHPFGNDPSVLVDNQALRIALHLRPSRVRVAAVMGCPVPSMRKAQFSTITLAETGLRAGFSVGLCTSGPLPLHRVGRS